jgi:hypothetical protein
LQALLTIDSTSAPVLVYPSVEAESTLLLSRLLFFDLHGEPFAPIAVHSIHKVQPTKASDNSDINLDLPLLVGAPTHQIVTLKQQILEQTVRFQRVHNELLDRATLSLEFPNEISGKCLETGGKIKSAILNELFPHRCAIQTYRFVGQVINAEQAPSQFCLDFLPSGVIRKITQHRSEAIIGEVFFAKLTR